MAHALSENAEFADINDGEVGFSITASDILEHLFCPRFTYFELYLKISEHQEKRFKVQKGRTIHEDKIRVNPEYLRKKLGCVERKKSVYLSCKRGLRGIVDEILFLDDGTAAPLDYKYAEYKERIFKNHKYQLAFYGQLIKENFQVPVNRGFIVYTRSQNKLIEVPITEQMYSELDSIIKDFLDVVQKGVYPKPTKYRARCGDCCYRNICEKVI
ncbi:MAG: CRISPR-associated protein Cas4 [Desulfobacterales bacterium]|nr:CRISPR-associated protein Cas4 [Desulfobacterales bacterium]